MQLPIFGQLQHDSIVTEISKITKSEDPSMAKSFIDSILRESLDDVILFEANYNYALVCKELNQVDSALIYSQKSLLIAEKLNNWTYVVRSQELLGLIAQLSGDHQLAISWFQKILDNPQEVDPYRYANIIGNSAISHYYLNKTDTAITLLNQALDLFQQNKQMGRYYSEKVNLAKFYFTIEEDEKSKKTLDEILENLPDTSQVTRVLALDLSAALNRLEKRFDEAEKNGLEILNIAEKLSDLSLYKIGHNSLYYTYLDKGDFEEALFHQEEFTYYKDSLFDINKHAEISKLRVQFESEKKENDLKLTRANLKEEEEKARRLKLVNSIIIGASIFILVLLILIIFNYRQKQKLARQKIELSNRKIDVILTEQEVKTKDAAIKGQEEERQRISRDLHDQLGGLLATIKLNFQAPDAPPINSETLKLIDQASSEVRRISHDLASGTISKFGLIPAIDDLCSALNNSGQIAVEFVHFGLNNRLPQKIELQIYRVIQELTSNVLKHAKATEISINLTSFEKELSIVFEDNGIGMKDNIKSAGIGLKNINQRVDQINGQITFDSFPGRGTTVNISLPLADITPQ